jgi:hypothetical protein
VKGFNSSIKGLKTIAAQKIPECILVGLLAAFAFCSFYFVWE